MRSNASFASARRAIPSRSVNCATCGVRPRIRGYGFRRAAQGQSYPSKPIRLIVPFPAGSATDSIARVFGAAVAGSIGQPVLIDNKAGADGAIAGAETAR